MAKTKTYSTAGFKSVEQKTKEAMTIHLEKTSPFAGARYNAYQTGSGVHGGTTKAQNRRERKNGKKLCRNWQD